MTVTSEVAPAVPAGAVAVIDVSEISENVVALTVPKSTAVAPVRPVPVMVTLVPPSTGPEDGLIAVTTGGPPVAVVVVVVVAVGAVVDEELPLHAANAAAAAIKSPLRKIDRIL